MVAGESVCVWGGGDENAVTDRRSYDGGIVRTTQTVELITTPNELQPYTRGHVSRTPTTESACPSTSGKRHVDGHERDFIRSH